MTQKELLELSLRARIAQAKGEGIRALFTPARTIYIFVHYKVWCTSSGVVMINRGGDEFFFHPMGAINGGPEPWWIECTNFEWAQDLLTKLRESQVLDQLARI